MKNKKGVSSSEFINYFWGLCQTVTEKEVTPTTVNSACNAGRNIIKMAYLREKMSKQAKVAREVIL